MDWKSLIADLAKAGVSQKTIGHAIGLSQPVVSDLARGRTTRIEWLAGEKLRQLYETTISEGKAAKTDMPSIPTGPDHECRSAFDSSAEGCLRCRP